MEIRIATEDDAAEALAVYSRYIGTPITFEYELPSVGEFARRIRSTLAEYPYLVYTEEERVRGYAYAHRLAEREAYRWGAELSVYLDSGVTSRGIGRVLYGVLIGLLKQQGVRTVYGCVTTPNPRSERLHEKLGFRRIGTLRRAGFKCGAWHDVTWFEKEIAAYDVPPPELIPFSRIAPEQIRGILGEYNAAPARH
ncbi:GNAT family N-acetyltransferase [Victivallis vadensis]|uniref:GNAT family N-acetyltransferase n=1 Tax=Victivallis vadensis TaxID=172901 RepID=UPI00266B4372|nr:GNAT family N-acetyltransferase [Victivallis vadensis]